ncbi:hypothetical protein [Cyanobium sp. ATX 6F1]|uniref:hypothetical protein n=1 Tax=unclassified Cyanobium TaxID=2627006 RepID=UPI0020CFD9A1|nr:hypothetical protein [Cyanobium sp. ATX 6F1]MCP9915260.1 hypothetical protein [Cyanobium sp. ATX 6F1]
MPRNTFRSDELLDLLQSCGSDLDALPLGAFHLLRVLITHVREQDHRISELELRCKELERKLAQLTDATSQPDFIELPASLFEEAFADGEEPQKSS